MDILRLKLAISGRIHALLLRRRFRKLGKRSRLISPLKLDGIERMEIGDGVVIGYRSWLAAVDRGQPASLVIGSGSTIGSFNEIYATGRIEIGMNVLTADNVYIADNTHDYEDITQPIIRQRVVQKAHVRIGDGAWLGRNAVVIGASVGRNSVIGANSVVLRDIPDFCVAVGAPARVVKKYDFQLGAWVMA